MAAVDDVIRVALEVLPELATFVPERRQELTTEGGLDVRADRRHLEDVIRTFHENKIEVSLFVDPIREQIETSKEIGADMIEIHTGEYANARSEREQNEQFVRIQDAAKLAKSIGLGVNGGHGLNYANVSPIAAIREIDELSIGHAIISHSMFVGLETGVKEMLALIRT